MKQSQIDFIKNNYTEMSDRKIAKIIDCSPATVCRIRNSNGWIKEHRDTICWECQRATGNCSWSQSLTPVEGWTANKTYIHNEQGGKMKSYKVIECPLFIPERKNDD